MTGGMFSEFCVDQVSKHCTDLKPLQVRTASGVLKSREGSGICERTVPYLPKLLQTEMSVLVLGERFVNRFQTCVTLKSGLYVSFV